MFLVLSPWNPHVLFVIFFERLVDEGFILQNLYKHIN